jgi:hypothetical protein
MRAVLISLMMGALLISGSACAFDPDGEQPEDEVATATQTESELATSTASPDDETAASLDETAASLDETAASLESDEPPGGPTTNTTYYDGCKKEHQQCHCQNTGWAGYCSWTVFWPDELVLRCKCA